MNDTLVVQTRENNPLDGIDLGNRATPQLIDFDGDGDLDIVASTNISIEYLENVGSSTQPQFVQRTGEANPFKDIRTMSMMIKASLGDVNGDGKIDTLVFGEYIGKSLGTWLQHFNYDGEQFVKPWGAAANPLDGLTGVGGAPEFVDLNGDGKQDLVVADFQGNLNFLLNEGNHKFTQQTDFDNPLWSIKVSEDAKPTFQDWDNDGDLDLFVGQSNGAVDYFENIGTATNPLFNSSSVGVNPFEGVQVNGGAAPAIGDLNGDGNLDVVIGDGTGHFTYLEGSAPPITTILGTGGDDLLKGSSGKDLIRGLTGDDTLLGLSGKDRLQGGKGDDLLKGGQGNDLLKGGQGHDILNGGSGKDTLTGGGGQDTFVYKKVDHSFDTITDFELGIDKIDLSGLFKGSDYTSANVFNDYVQLEQLGADTKVRVDVLGDNGDQFETIAQLTNVNATTFTAAQFVLD